MTYKSIFLAWGAAAVLPVCASAALEEEESTQVRNVVLIFMDDQGKDLSYLGTAGLSTPNLDRLIGQGVYFSNAYGTCASCAPSRSSILTGMYPHSHGHWRNTTTPTFNHPDSDFGRESTMLDEVRIHESITTLNEILEDHGYFTGITHKFHLSPPWKFPFESRVPVKHDHEEFERVISQMIEESGERPFFIKANIEPPHRSFRTKPYFWNLFEDGTLYDPDVDAIEVPDYMPDIQKVRDDLQEYYASVQVSDACAGGILRALDKSGRLHDTLVIYSSDNGMPMYRAKASAYPAGTHMPLAFAGPGIKSGQVCDQVVSLADLMPTMLDALGLPTPSTVQGESLWPWLSGNGALPDRDYVFTEFNSHGAIPNAEGTDLLEAFPQRAVTDGRWYYILNLDPTKPQTMPDDLIGAGVWRNEAYPAILAAAEDYPEKVKLLTDMIEGRRPAEELYDLKSDPWAMNNLAGDPAHAEKLEKLRNLVNERRERHGDIQRSVMEF